MTLAGTGSSDGVPATGASGATPTIRLAGDKLRFPRGLRISLQSRGALTTIPIKAI